MSGIGGHTLPDVEAFCAGLDSLGVAVSLLVAPRLKGGYRLERDPATVDWLTGRRLAGDAVVLHGFDEAATTHRRGEFARLPAHEANLRLAGADRVLEHLGLRTRLFAAPGWTVSPGTVTALPGQGFRVLAGMHGITDLVRGSTVPARVLGIGGGLRTEPAWCRMLVRSVQRTASRGGIVRIGAAGSQLRKPALAQAMLDAVDMALRYGCIPAVYSWQPEPAVPRVA